MRRTLLGLAVLAAFALPAAATAAGQGGIEARLIATPQAASTNPLGRLFILARLAPGATLTRTVEISNKTAASTALAVYPAAASNIAGQFAFAPGHTQNELSRWTVVSNPTLSLSPSGHATETVTIVVPPGATDGERAAVVWTEIRAAGSTGVQLVNRVGVRVYLIIGAGAFHTAPTAPPHTTPTLPPAAGGGSFWSAHLSQILAAVALLLVAALALTGFGMFRGRRGAHGLT
ncbi:MAG TPA: hypothetical protein VGN06_11280 [Gaiellaceae bacterium]|jgi:hypothetical protein